MIVGIVGFIGSGKSTAGDLLEIHHGFKRDSFAGPLKDITSTLFGWPRHLLEGDTQESREFRETVDKRWSDMLEYEITPRYALQLIGTEVFRDGLHPDIWLLNLKNRYEKAGCPKTVVTDVRFPNEMQFIRDQGGKIVMIERGDLPSWFNYVRVADTFEEAQNYMEAYFPNLHASEWRWVRSISHTQDWIIRNDEGIDKLKKELNNFVQKGLI